MNKLALIDVRNRLQSLLDNYQINGTAEQPFKAALVELNGVIDAPADSAPTVPTAPTINPDDIAAAVAGRLLDSFNDISQRMNLISGGVARLLTPAPSYTAPAATPAAPAAQPAQ